jgi:pyruvate/2-oxoglutarate dehydrogenase complex dihydrolipoamide acyltransferase (E2) component
LLAEERGLDISLVKGTGPAGIISKGDVEGYKGKLFGRKEKRIQKMRITILKWI